jgi:hypothetical protein
MRRNPRTAESRAPPNPVQANFPDMSRWRAMPGGAASDGTFPDRLRRIARYISKLTAELRD